MLNLGLIGHLNLLEPYIESARQDAHVFILGKSSVGIPSQHDNPVVQVPEFNRIELIERSDILFINKFSLLPFSLLAEMVKKSKHFFAASYPGLTPSEIFQLAKLATEARTTVQISNPFYYLPALRWLSTKVKHPVFIDVTYFHPDASGQSVLLQLILMLQDFSAQIVRKVSAITFSSGQADASIQNIHLDLGNGSKVNLTIGRKSTENRFTVNAYMDEQFAELDLIHNIILLNSQHIDIGRQETTNETNAFLNAVRKNKQAATGLESYANALQTVRIIEDKLSRYSKS